METAKSVFLALVVTFGLVWVLASQMPATPARQQSEIDGRPERGTPSLDAVQAAPEPELLSDQPEAVAPTDIEQLRKACVAEVRNAGSATRSSSSACARYEQAVALGGDPTINVIAAPTYRGSTSAPRAGRSVERTIGPTLVPHECRMYAYGSIRYRECRADEKKRLLAVCAREKKWADRTSGEQRQMAKAVAAANCRVAELYEIVK